MVAQCRRQPTFRSVMLNLVNPHTGDARLSEAECYGGLRRYVDDPAADERPSTNDPDDHAAAVIEIDDTDLRSDPIGRLRCAATGPVKRGIRSRGLRLTAVPRQPIFPIT